MIIEHCFMRRRLVGLLLVVVAGLSACTKPNPRSCADGTCTDPAFPFCDVDGTVEGAPNTCISGECTPSTFAGCRGDIAITCNADGTNYDTTQCERGCAADTGCRLCDPDEAACTNGTVATCDANGTVVSQQACPLGCFESEPRCRDIDPSNGLAQFLDMVPDPPELDLSGDAFINTATGEVGRVGGPLLTIPSFSKPAPAGGSGIRVFVVHSAHLGNVEVGGNGAAITDEPQPALAIVASGDIVIDGSLSLGALSPGGRSYGATPGGVIFPACRGGAGRDNTFGGCHAFAGAGGGGHATAGGKVVTC